MALTVHRCIVLALAAATLAACANAPQKQASTPVPLPETTAQPPMPLPAPDVPATIAAPAQPPTIAPPASPWERLRARQAMPGCEYSPAVQRWSHIFTQGPQQFAANLKRAMPFLLLTIDELERAELPGEFALLPYLESTYEPIPTKGDVPAGMWQYIPDTARGAGLRVGRDYDGRLDAYASAQASAGLLRRYQDEFGDWRLVDMAFNAGEFAVKQLLRGKEGPYDADDVAKLKLSSVTHEHLAKLLALSCIVAAPERFAVQLPEPDPDDYLVAVDLGAPLDLRLAARLAGVDEDKLRRYNSGYRTGRIGVDGGPLRLLLPLPAQAAFQRRYAAMPAELWSKLAPVKLNAAHGVSELAQSAGVDAPLFAELHGVEASGELGAGHLVFLPATTPLGTPPRSATPPAGPPPATHTVRAGDTLWDLAVHYKIKLEDLKRWNGLSATSGLKPGQTLRLVAPN